MSGAARGFRGDIQGLRAVAVATVMVGHAGLGPFSGGFVGVDVFFVLSGFLITGLLLAEAERTGRVSLVGFYVRRARRILPAASAVLVATLVAASLLLGALDVGDLATDAWWAALFAVNVRFAQQGTDYFAQDAATSAVQHYWSLAVEEQFYLVWPLLVLALCTWRAASRVSLRRRLLVAIALLSAASLVWSALRTAEEPSSAYFSSLTRAWELGAGAMCALLAHRGTTGWPRWTRDLLALAGLGAVLTACLAYSEETPFPGVAAALPVLGTAAVVLAGSGTHAEPGLVGRALGVAPLRLVGDWSYSLYLWHWPVLVIPTVRWGRDLTTVEALGLLALTFVLAGLSHRLVETPFRTGRRWSPPRGLVLYPVSLVLVVGSAWAAGGYAERQVSERGDDPAITLQRFGVDDPRDVRLPRDRTRALVKASVIAAEHGMAVPSDLTPDLVDIAEDVPDVGECDYDAMNLVLCPRGDVDAARTLVVVGDSHGRMWIPAFEQIAREQGYRTYYLVKPRCSAVLVDAAEPGTDQPFPECGEFHDWMLEQVADLRPDLTVVATAPPALSGIFDDTGTLVRDPGGMLDLVRGGFEGLYAALAPLTDRLVALGDIPRLPILQAGCLSSGDPDLGDCLSEPVGYARRVAETSGEVAAAAGLPFVDPISWLCFRDRCPAVIGSTVPYRDYDHLTVERARELAGPLWREISAAR